MALTKQTAVDQIEIKPELGVTQVRQAKYLLNDVTGEREFMGYHRTVIEVGEDTKADALLAPEHSAFIKSLWTPEIITKAAKRRTMVSK